MTLKRVESIYAFGPCHKQVNRAIVSLMIAKAIRLIVSCKKHRCNDRSRILVYRSVRRSNGDAKRSLFSLPCCEKLPKGARNRSENSCQRHIQQLVFKLYNACIAPKKDDRFCKCLFNKRVLKASLILVECAL